MKINDYKYKLQASLRVFCVGMLTSCAVLFYISKTGKILWMLGPLFSLIFYSVLGIFVCFRGLLRLTEAIGHEVELSQEEYIDRLYGVEGANFTILTSIPLICFLTYIICYRMGINILVFEKDGWIQSILISAAVAVLLYRTAADLSINTFAVTLFDTLISHEEIKDSRNAEENSEKKGSTHSKGIFGRKL
jgi:hypothetical protein